ncbi:hypothetical protein [Rhizobium leguminosarum]|uniref:hypothetical protein n=1 Tax=Rhizobium leguminosarum TaxID=384 RepID=UPI001C98C732|nr:hypothetical protein [Rhizobium leguminosarum]MBY5643869.1 hypothetical protein [Rhizobium leguminosarum]
MEPSRRLTDEGERDHAKAALERAFAALRPDTRGTAEKIDAFARLMREKVTQGPIRRAYLRSDIDQVEVDRIRIHGRRDVLERLVMSRTAAAGVPSFCIENGAPDEMKLTTPRHCFSDRILSTASGHLDRWPVLFLIGRAEPTFGARVCGLGMTKSAG